MLPSRRESEEGNPEDAIERRDLGLGFLLAVGGKLLAEGQLDNHLLAVAAKESRSASHDEH